MKAINILFCVSTGMIFLSIIPWIKHFIDCKRLSECNGTIIGYERSSSTRCIVRYRVADKEYHVTAPHHLKMFKSNNPIPVLYDKSLPHKSKLKNRFAWLRNSSLVLSGLLSGTALIVYFAVIN